MNLSLPILRPIHPRTLLVVGEEGEQLSSAGASSLAFESWLDLAPQSDVPATTVVATGAPNSRSAASAGDSRMHFAVRGPAEALSALRSHFAPPPVVAASRIWQPSQTR